MSFCTNCKSVHRKPDFKTTISWQKNCNKIALKGEQKNLNCPLVAESTVENENPLLLYWQDVSAKLRNLEKLFLTGFICWLYLFDF